MSKVVCIIQARMGSTRLPGKVMKKMKGKSVLFYVVERVKQSRLIDQIVIATTTNKHDDVIVEEAERLNVSWFRGSEQDVLSRYYYAAKKFDADVVVRVTSDCPLIDSDIIDKVVKKHINSNYDYTSNTIKRTFPRGLDVEVFNFDVLKDSFKNAEKNYEREHVTPYIYQNHYKFNAQNIEAKEKELKRPEIRITVDTIEDFNLIKNIILNFNNHLFSSIDVLDFLDKKPELLDLNKDIKQKKLGE